ncbi:MAG: 2,3,4,5-tetrahydropyridine-2,6-dicarboxylate N-succinyltransferase [Holosporales bacterium]|jgi:2,3,4,5-tetrahydropyridine-2-carboxylate N-succinyltransferase|nr:2,3,4,5-tetrahydropyridine-2,6-dicarboxylate N-succinyltransferase [Holosporales bacterium]
MNETAICSAWERRADLSREEWYALSPLLEACLEALNTGHARIATKTDAGWQVVEFLKKAVLLYIASRSAQIFQEGTAPCWDKVPLKTTGWTEKHFQSAGFRMCPGAIVRYGAYIAPSVVIMPSFINMGAFIDAETLIDSWVTIGSCAQIGKQCHISEGAALGGVLEPIQSLPVIIEDNCFIGGRTGIFEGVRVCEGAVIASGVILNASTRIIDRTTGQHFYGTVRPYAVVVPGSYETAPGINVSCAVIVKTVDAQTRTKVGINALLHMES